MTMRRTPVTASDRRDVDGRRLNCFAFPSDTTWRFLLVVAATLGSAMMIYAVLFLHLPGELARAQEANTCAENVRSLPAETYAEQRAVSERFRDCYRPFDRRMLVFQAGSLAAMGLVAGAIYALTPKWKIRRRRLVPLERDDAPEVVSAFDELCSEAGLQRRPTLLWNPLNRSGGALAFGGAGRYHVAVGSGLVTQFYLDKEPFTAVLRHELGHMANRDVGKTYLTMSVWWAFLFTAVLPFAIVDVGRIREASHVGNVATNLLQTGLLAVLVYLTRNATLRSREYYADVRASLPSGGRRSLERVLAGLPAPRPWRSVMGLHPSPTRRRSVVADTSELFRFEVGDALAAGIVAGIATSVLNLFWPRVVNAGLVPFESRLVVPAFVGFVFGAFYGIGVSRETFAARVGGQPLPRLRGVALAAAGGLVAGTALRFDELGALPLVPRIDVGTAVAALVTALLLTVWLRGATDVWLDALPGRRSARPLATVVLAGAGLWAWAWAWCSLVLDDLTLRGLVGDVDYVAGQTGTLLVVVGLVLVLLIPLALSPRRPGGKTPDWAWIERSSDSQLWPTRGGLRYGRAALGGLAFGVVYGIIVLALRATNAVSFETPILRTLGLWEIRPTLEAFPEGAAALTEGAGKLGHFRAHVGLALVVQLALGIVAGVKTRRAPELHAVVASVAAGLVMAAGLVGVSAIYGGEWSWDFHWMVRKTVLNPGVFVAFVASAVTTFVRRELRGRASGETDDAGPPEEAMHGEPVLSPQASG